MTYRVIIQPRAERDIQNAARWVFQESKSKTATLRWVRMIRGKIETLGSNPRRCPVDPDSEFYGEEVRVLLAGKRQGVYRVLFTIRDDFVHILTVRHSARRTLGVCLSIELRKRNSKNTVACGSWSPDSARFRYEQDLSRVVA